MRLEPETQKELKTSKLYCVNEGRHRVMIMDRFYNGWKVEEDNLKEVSYSHFLIRLKSDFNFFLEQKELQMGCTPSRQRAHWIPQGWRQTCGLQFVHGLRSQ